MKKEEGAERQVGRSFGSIGFFLTPRLMLLKESCLSAIRPKKLKLRHGSVSGAIFDEELVGGLSRLVALRVVAERQG
jgi:hypothetical protein